MGTELTVGWRQAGRLKDLPVNGESGSKLGQSKSEEDKLELANKEQDELEQGRTEQDKSGSRQDSGRTSSHE